MKVKTSLLLILGLTSSIAFAQSSDPQAQSGSQSQQRESVADSRTQPESQSSGDSGSPRSGASSSGRSEDRSAASGHGDTTSPMVQLEPKSENGFTYLCGGVGQEEAAQMKQAARDYDLMLTFATRSGAYLADVNVDIKDARGQAELQTTCDGPIMLVDVPRSGTYQIHAKAGDYTLNKTARLQAKGQRHAALILIWPQQVAESSGTGQTSSGGDGKSGTSASGSETR
jgi:hypothetical protein